MNSQKRRVGACSALIAVGLPPRHYPVCALSSSTAMATPISVPSPMELDAIRKGQVKKTTLLLFCMVGLTEIPSEEVTADRPTPQKEVPKGVKLDMKFIQNPLPSPGLQTYVSSRRVVEPLDVEPFCTIESQYCTQGFFVGSANLSRITHWETSSIHSYSTQDVSIFMGYPSPKHFTPDQTVCARKQESRLIHFRLRFSPQAFGALSQTFQENR
ncbi:hypothetical protein MKZ38_001200 [Zalerion maritima]|uniref:Uncharacterized protein n=1 Tax=Zalerion maritima TaxID=339359 RepID=A0AAD5WY31_9PEZI|nr:hypothetical protein MKZ38_001200 [Zalerion maritima]